MQITAGDYDRDIEQEGLDFQRSHYFEPPPGSFWARRIERCLAFLRPSPGDMILDVGCGVGTLAFHAARRGARCVGADYSRKSIEVACRLSAEYEKSGWVRYLVADAHELPFAGSLFAKVVAADFVEHIPDSSKPGLFREMHRVLKPGGILVVFTDNLLYERLALAARNLRNRLRGKSRARLEDKNPLHVGLITAASCARMLREAGFSVEAERFFPNELSALSKHLPLAAALAASTPGVRRILAQNFLLSARKR